MRGRGLTTEHVGADVRRAAPLVLQRVVLTDEVFAETEVGQRDPLRLFVQHHVSQLEVAMNDVLLPTQTAA